MSCFNKLSDCGITSFVSVQQPSQPGVVGVLKQGVVAKNWTYYCIGT